MRKQFRKIAALGIATCLSMAGSMTGYAGTYVEETDCTLPGMVVIGREYEECPQNGTWVQDDIGWRFEIATGKYAAECWYCSPTSGLWYCLGTKGYMLTDTITPEGYYVNADGVWDGKEAIKIEKSDMDMGGEEFNMGGEEFNMSEAVEALQEKYRREAEEILNDPKVKAELFGN